MPKAPLFLRVRVHPFPRAKGARGRLYFNVCLFRDRATMRELNRIQHEKDPHIFRRFRRFEALAQYYEICGPKGKRRTSNCVGQVLFHREFMGARVVAHEMTHMALYAIAGRTKAGYTLTTRQDERMAACVGELCRQFYVAYWKWEKRGWVKESAK